MARDRLAAMRAAQQGQGGGAYSPPSSLPAPHSSFGGTYGQQSPYTDEPPRSGGRGDTQAGDSYEMQQPYNDKPAAASKYADMQSFMDEVTLISDGIDDINRNVNQIRDLHARAGSQLDENQQALLAQQLGEKQQETTRLTNNVKHRLDTLNSTNSAAPRHDVKPRVSQVASLKKRLMASIGTYQEVEKKSRQQYRDRMERQYKIVKPNATQEEIRQALDSDDQGQVFSQALMSSNRYGDARAAYREVQQRHEDLKSIEKTIVELAQMMQDLALMVEQQDENLQAVEASVAQAADNIGDAEGQLKVARKSAAAARRKRWICFWIIVAILIVVGIVVAVVIVTNNNKK